MSNNYGPGIVSVQASKIVSDAFEQEHLPFRKGLDESTLSTSIMVHFPSYRDRVFTPIVTLFGWLSQVLSADKSCRQAVAHINSDRIAAGFNPATSTTQSYCEARQRLTKDFIQELAYFVGHGLEDEIPPDWLWHGREVKVVDGSTFTMDDTPENQGAFPQPSSQKEGAGFPQARMVALMSLGTGSILDAAFGPYKGKETGEHALLRSILHQFQPGDIALGDAYYGTYFLIAKLRSMEVDCLFHIHGARDVDFRCGRRIGKGDHLVIWDKPPKKPAWMTDEEYALYPDEMIVRETNFNVDIPGFRSKHMVVVTTLVDKKKHSKMDLANLYRRRWAAEINLRTLKSVMKMEQIRCRTPEMVAKDFWIHVLAYNLIRKLIAQSALLFKRLPWQTSFKGAVQTLSAYKNLWKYTTTDPQMVLKFVCWKLLVSTLLAIGLIELNHELKSGGPSIIHF